MSKIEWTGETLFGSPLPRRCRKCRVVKPSSEFKVDRSRVDGIAYICRACEYTRKHPDRPSRSERTAQASNDLAWCAGCRTWMAINKVRSGRCRSCHRAYDRQRYASDEAYRSERRQHAHARKRGVDPIPPEGQEALLWSFAGECAYCDAPATTWDHVIPITKGGKTTPDNILPACASCNSSKGNRNLFPWLEATGRQMKLVALERLAHFQVIE